MHLSFLSRREFKKKTFVTVSPHFLKIKIKTKTKKHKMPCKVDVKQQEREREAWAAEQRRREEEQERRLAAVQVGSFVVTTHPIILTTFVFFSLISARFFYLFVPQNSNRSLRRQLSPHTFSSASHFAPSPLSSRPTISLLLLLKLIG